MAKQFTINESNSIQFNKWGKTMKTGMLKTCMTLAILAMLFGPGRTFAEEAIKVLPEQQTGLAPGEG
ncbi:MAG: hypothetical protein MUP26_08780, partial [Desulfobulbaceae bacterium]|nr:hypothetical protein [Desulfobulbaceae bacterium]